MMIAMAYRESPKQNEEPILASLRQPFAIHGHELRTIALNPKCDDNELEKQLNKKVSSLLHHSQWILGGFSLGARIAAQLSPKVHPSGLLYLGFPFYHCRKPAQALGLKHLQNTSNIETLIVQGEHDPYGTKEDLEKSGFPDTLKISWIKGANHRFQSKAIQHKESIASLCVEFAQSIERQAI